MSDAPSTSSPQAQDTLEQARRAAERLFGHKPDLIQPPASDIGAGPRPNGINSLDLLQPSLQPQIQRRPSPFIENNPNPFAPTSSGSDRQSDKPNSPVQNGVLKVNYGDADFDSKLALKNYSKVIITGLPDGLSPSPWLDEKEGKGFFFWFKNKQNDANSDRNKHYFPSNVKEIEIAHTQGSFYAPTLINADDMRIAANQAFMKEQNKFGYGSYQSGTDALSYAANMSKMAGQALQYQEQLLRESAKTSPNNPYFHIYLADVLTAQAVQPVIQALANGKPANFDNPQTNAKLAEAIRETQIAGLITRIPERGYGNLRRPPDHEMPLSPFSLNPNAYNPDAYWSGAAYQAAIREVQLSSLKSAIAYGRLPTELPPALPPKQ